MATLVLDPVTHITASVPRIPRQFQKFQYKDRQFMGGEAEWKKKLESSSTVYVGNISCYTNELQLYELFTRCGSIKRIIMGIDRIKKTPCGFCFIEFDERESALKSINLINRTYLDGRQVNVNMDAGFQENRQYGRGVHGGQLGDERKREREQDDGSRGGYRTGGPGDVPILTRSITVVACMAMISMLLIAACPSPVESELVLRPYSEIRGHSHLHPAYIRRAQMNETRVAFEKSFAQFLVGIMKSAKPTLLQAFIQATLADKQLKEIAIAMFFNNTSTDNE